MKKAIILAILSVVALTFLSLFFFKLSIIPNTCSEELLDYGEYNGEYRIKFKTFFCDQTTLKENGNFSFPFYFYGRNLKVLIPKEIHDKYYWKKVDVTANQFYLRLKENKRTWKDVPAEVECYAKEKAYNPNFGISFNFYCHVNVQKYAEMYNTKISLIRVRRGTFTIVAKPKEVGGSIELLWKGLLSILGLS